MSKIRVLIADDHALMRDGIKALLRDTADIEVVGEAADGRAAIELSRRLKPEIVLMDIAMPGLGGLEATLEIRRESPRTRVLVLTQYDDREYIHRFLKLGIAGYILKHMLGAQLAASIRSAAEGGLVLDPKVAQEAIESYAPGAGGEAAADPYDALTDREKQVLRLVALGHSNKEIAQLLGTSVKTAMSHREHVMQKLNLHNRTDLVRFAIRQGVIRIES